MTQQTVHCQGCGASLPSADAICARCEVELTAEPPRPPAKYVCPHCQERFAEAANALWPPHVPWWRPQTFRLQCPRCDAPLRDRRQPSTPRWTLPAVVIAGLCLQFFVDDWALRSGLLFVLLVGLFAYLHKCTERGFPEEHRYVAGTSQRWFLDARHITKR